MDPLSDVLKVTRLKGGVFLHGMFGAPWCLSVRVLPETCAPYIGDTAHIIAYHYVVEGELEVALENSDAFSLNAGESVIFPRNDRHVLGSDVKLPAVLSENVVRKPESGELATITLDGGGARSSIVCGFLGAQTVAGNPLLQNLPDVLRLDCREDVAATWVRETFQYAAEEIASGRPGSDAILGKVSELLFAEAIRRYAEQLPDGADGWLQALRDRWVSRALVLLHHEIDCPWTVDALGARVGLSRAALTERFNRTVGMAPMQYLNAWRIHVAAQELLHSGQTIAEVAAAVGYASEAAFTRAFKRQLGLPPARWRRRLADDLQESAMHGSGSLESD